MSSLLAAAAALLVLAAARELWAERGEQARRWLHPLVERLGEGLGRPGERDGALADRLRRAGLDGWIEPWAVPLARVLAALCALPTALLVAPAAPGRTGLLVAVGVPLAAAALPDLWLERRVRSRRAAIEAAMPDALELMAVGAAAGRSTAALIAEAGRAAPPPLAEELARTVAEIESGRSQAAALARLGAEAGGELAGLAVLLDRSRRLGSPLASGLRERAASLRRERARLTRDRAARAAPKIQLVVALLLVPSVLLIVGAAIVANTDALLVGL